jgi:hypothetical protein
VTKQCVGRANHDDMPCVVVLVPRDLNYRYRSVQMQAVCLAMEEGSR